MCVDIYIYIYIYIYIGYAVIEHEGNMNVGHYYI